MPLQRKRKGIEAFGLRSQLVARFKTRIDRSFCPGSQNIETHPIGRTVLILPSGKANPARIARAAKLPKPVEDASVLISVIPCVVPHSGIFDILRSHPCRYEPFLPFPDTLSLHQRIDRA